MKGRRRRGEKEREKRKRSSDDENDDKEKFPSSSLLFSSSLPMFIMALMVRLESGGRGREGEEKKEKIGPFVSRAGCKISAFIKGPEGGEEESQSR